MQSDVYDFFGVKSINAVLGLTKPKRLQKASVRLALR